MAAGSHKVVLIGPVLPFRGGIAQHTTMLLHAFREFAGAQAISFTRQYPKLIFPGESDRDPAFEGHVEPHTTYLIDSVNPLTWRKAVKLAIAEKPDVVVLPWWQVYWAPSFSYIARRIRRAGIPWCSCATTSPSTRRPAGSARSPSGYSPWAAATWCTPASTLSICRVAA